MSVELTRRQMKILAHASIELKRLLIGRMTATDALDFDADFESWAHKMQLPPPENGWRNWLMLAGRGFGKTRAGAEWIEKLGRSRPGVRIALVGGIIPDSGAGDVGLSGGRSGYMVGR